MNSLHNSKQNWVGDGSNGALEVVNDNDIVIASASAGTPFNVRLDSANTVEDYHFQVTINKLKGNLSIGVVSKDEFRPGWKTKGMFYNGNLTNGSGALKTSWGPRFQEGDTLGVSVTSGKADLEVTFFKNSSSLGTGFSLSQNKDTYYPCLHVSGQASLRVEFPEELPPVELSEESVPKSFFGEWKLEAAWDGETQVPVPETKGIMLRMERDSDTSLQMSFKIGNSIGGRAQILEENEATMSIEHGPFPMTRMMPPPELRPLETLLSTKKMTTLQMEGKDALLVSGPEMKTNWKRHVREPETLTKY